MQPQHRLEPGYAPGTSMTRSAAVWVWVIGVMEILFSSCLAGSVFVAVVMPRQQLFDQLRRDWTPQQVEQFELIYPLLGGYGFDDLGLRLGPWTGVFGVGVWRSIG